MSSFCSDFQKGGDSKRDVHFRKTSSTKRAKRIEGLHASLHLE